MRRRAGRRRAGLRASAREGAVEVERTLAREHFVQHQAQRVHVGPRRQFAPFLLFWRHVAECSCNLRGAAPLVGQIRETEIREVRPTPSVDQHVRGLQIAMQNLAVVCCRETGAELTCKLERLVRWQPANAPQQRREILAVDVLHGEEVLASGFADVVHAAHVWMRDQPREPDFLMEPRKPVSAMRDLARQELESHSLSELQVLGAIDFAHPAAAQQADDPIAAGQHRTRNELRAVERVRRRQPIGRGQRRRLRCVNAGAACRAVAARFRNVAPTGRTTHVIGMILVERPCVVFLRAEISHYSSRDAISS
jgi:hypothetical protein